MPLRILIADDHGVMRAAEEELIAAIQAISRGEMYIHPAITRLLFPDRSPSINLQKDGLQSLTPREVEIMGYLAGGYTNRQIAERLFLSVRTVESHRANILDKLGLKNRVELVEFVKNS